MNEPSIDRPRDDKSLLCPRKALQRLLELMAERVVEKLKHDQSVRERQ